ncbi:FG-GAP repeat domain-containing protein [Schlesneria sp. T3-172]|uniref:FG-GAP repeat domain-containing protein n=1 Tax=Schlesneria sphaerica TaxID=3373610 RepID=UPI0037C940CD
MNRTSIFCVGLVGTILAASLVAVTALGLVVTGIDPSEISLTGQNTEETLERQVIDFCGACHVVPRPDALPRSSWGEEIEKAFERYRVSGRSDLKVPSQSRVTKYFLQRAVEMLPIPNVPDAPPSPVLFRPDVQRLPNQYGSTAVSFLDAIHVSPGVDSQMDLLLCDMGNGSVNRFSWQDGVISSTELGRVNHPAHVVPCDFDRDGNQDFLIADLGMLKPTDELLGSVTLLRSSGSGRPFEAISILDHVARVADAQLADLDGDGDLDFVIAEFGFEQVGRLIWLETLSMTRGRPETKLHLIDARHGAIRATPVDLDGDGDLDLVGMFGQEHEAIIAYLNDGACRFEPRTLYQADSPSSGSTGLELADLDGDLDLDVLFTNGDTLDTMQIKPYHGVNWLENLGDGQFAYHRLAELPGAVRAIPGDLDGDGKLDIVAVAFCPPFLRYQVRPQALDTVIWLKQIRPGEYQRYSLERSNAGPYPVAAGSMSIAAGDFDQDGDLDFTVGQFNPYETPSLRSADSPRKWFTVYWNEGMPEQADGEINQTSD